MHTGLCLPQVVDVIPDMTMLGKAIGGGLPIGALGGRNTAMAVFDPAKKGVLSVPVSVPQREEKGSESLGLSVRETFEELESSGALLFPKKCCQA